MKIIISISILFVTVLNTAQTKVIAHKSHSGNSKNFSKAYQRNLFDMRNSNFGLPGNQTIFVLDTVIAINDSVTILKRRESIVCYQWGTDYKNLKKRDFKHIQDTLINSKVLNASNTIAFIKANEHQIYSEVYYMNPFEEIVFIGFKNDNLWIEDCRPVAPRIVVK